MGFRIEAAIATNVGLEGGPEFPEIVPTASKPTEVPRTKILGEVPRTAFHGTEVFIKPVDSVVSVPDMGQRGRPWGPSCYRLHQSPPPSAYALGECTLSGFVFHDRMAAGKILETTLATQRVAGE